MLLRIYYYSLKQLFRMICISIGIIFTAFSLFFFNPYAQSLFYAHSEAVDGWWYCMSYAGLLYYVCGGAAWLLVGLSSLFLYHLFFQFRIKDNWEQYVIMVGLIPVTSWLLSFCALDCAHGFNPGGFLGICMMECMQMSDQVVWCTAMIWFGMSAVVVLARSAVIKPLEFLQSLIYSFILFIQKYRVDKKLVSSMLFFYRYFVCMPLAMIVHISVYLYRTLVLRKNRRVVIGKEQNNTQESLYKSLHSDGQVPLEQEERVMLFPEKSHVAEHDLDNSHENLFHDQTEMAEQEIQLEEIMPEEIVSVDTQYELPLLHSTVLSSQEKIVKKLRDEQELRIQALEDKLQKFGVKGKVVSMSVGPVVTLFEYQPESDIKLSKILTLEDDLSMAMQALSIRILAPIPGTSVVGFEVANNTRCDVLLSDVMNTNVYKKFSGQLPLVLGKNTTGESIVVDLVKMPHLLVAGSTGAGKSVALNAMLISLLCKLDPDQLKLILIDPKRLEFACYADIAHLEFPIITDPKKVASVLRWVVQQMEERYDFMAQAGVRNIVDYNAWLQKRGQKKLPFLVVVIDELADLMLSVGRDIEDLIARIAQMARASGIHLIVATQRPSVDVITGLIKANFPSRISFRVSSRIDSRTILDTSGAEKLLGKGDMLFIHASSAQMDRIHGAYVSDQEIDSVVEHIRAIRPVEYRDLSSEIAAQESVVPDEDDELYQEVCLFLDSIEEVSISLLQRKFRIGYNRAARMIDLLESQGKIMPPDGAKTRKIIPQ